VEKADALRGGGYPIDIRGTALDVVERMGLLADLRAAHVGTQRITFLNPDGSPITTVRPEALAGGVEGRDLEVRRGDLANLLHAATATTSSTSSTTSSPPSRSTPTAST
jgi:2-polyprenyl-6-methoxyphenol hydroxylase-like FAD-dependent oxidoreductase